MPRRAAAFLILLIATGCSSIIYGVGCSTERRYELEGQVLAVDPAKEN